MAQRGRKPTPKTQKEISRSLQGEPYDKSMGNPNDFPTGIENRGNQVSFRGDNTKPFSIGLENIDGAIIYYLENIIRPTVIQNGVVEKVPVIYGSPERWKQVQKDGYYRDQKNKIMLPLIIFKQSGIEPNRGIYNKIDANNPNNISVFTKSYSPKDAYNNFSILNNQKPIKQYYAVVVPDYVTITYDFIISTYYVEQMNKILEAMNYASNSYWGDPEQFKFKATIDSFAPSVQIDTGGERLVKSTFSLKLYGYIIPSNIQKELSYLKKFNSKSQVVFNVEIVSNINDI
jgi:hypothetical protein